jgi:hypothetical protein
MSVAGLRHLTLEHDGIARTELLCETIAAIAVGWVLYRTFWPHPEEAPQWELEQEPDEPAIAAPLL